MSAEEQVPPPVVDLAIDGVFHLPPSRDTRRQQVTIATILAALLLHALVIALLLADWRPAPLAPVRPLRVNLVREAPKPPPPAVKKPEPPKPQANTEPPKPKPAPEKPKPKPEEKKPPLPPPAMKPRESGPDDKTEAVKSDQPKSELPKALPIEPAEPVEKPPPEPEPPAPKPTPPHAKAKESAGPHGIMVPLAMLPPALRPQRPSAPPIRNLVLRLPGPGGGTGTRDRTGDAYLNRLQVLLERNRLYPPAADFGGASSRNAIYSIVIEPSGAIVTVTLLSSTGVTKLDEVAREMITNSDPFPHLPGDYAQIRTEITVFLPVFPAR